MDETPVYFNNIPDTTVDFVGKRQITVRSFNQEKMRCSVLLTVNAEGDILPPLVILKGRPFATIFKKLQKLECVKNKRMFIFT
jgi:hypothetical protein